MVKWTNKDLCFPKLFYTYKFEKSHCAFAFNPHESILGRNSLKIQKLKWLYLVWKSPKRFTHLFTQWWGGKRLHFTLFCSFKLDGHCVSRSSLKLCQRFLIGFSSRLWLGHSGTLLFFDRNRSIAAPAICLKSFLGDESLPPVDCSQDNPALISIYPSDLASFCVLCWRKTSPQYDAAATLTMCGRCSQSDVQLQKVISAFLSKNFYHFFNRGLNLNMHRYFQIFIH